MPNPDEFDKEWETYNTTGDASSDLGGYLFAECERLIRESAAVIREFENLPKHLPGCGSEHAADTEQLRQAFKGRIPFWVNYSASLAVAAEEYPANDWDGLRDQVGRIIEQTETL